MEETEDPGEAPGRATVISTLILLGIYVIVAVAAQAYAGVDQLVANQEDVLSALGTEVFGSPLDKTAFIFHAQKQKRAPRHSLSTMPETASGRLLFYCLLARRD